MNKEMILKEMQKYLLERADGIGAGHIASPGDISILIGDYVEYTKLLLQNTETQKDDTYYIEKANRDLQLFRDINNLMQLKLWNWIDTWKYQIYGDEYVDAKKSGVDLSKYTLNNPENLFYGC